jgi:hypothetical protein
LLPGKGSTTARNKIINTGQLNTEQLNIEQLNIEHRTSNNERRSVFIRA